jgi:type IV pilus assembly protein PilM
LAKSEQKRLIGLDMGSSSVKLVELSSNGESYELERLALVPLGTGDSREATKRAVSMILESETVQCRRAATSVSGAQVAVRVLRFPHLSREEIEGAVRYEGGQVIGFDIDDAYVDYTVLDAHEADDDGGSGRTDVLFVAAGKGEVEWRADMLSRSGLEPVFMGVDMLVLLDAVLLQPDVGKTVSVLHVGACSTGIGVTQGGAIPFVRDIEMGGNAFTKVISESAGISFGEAETAKVTGESWCDETDRAVKEVIGHLVGEIHRSMVYYQTRSHGAKVEKVMLCGGSSRLRGLKPMIEESLDIPVDFWSPIDEVKVDGGRFDLPSVGQLSPFVALATALAMRSEVA